MTITYHDTITQGSFEWYNMRCGILTASEMKHIITPGLKVASNDKEKEHLYELTAQRFTRYVEPAYISDDMIRGTQDELLARDMYSRLYAPVKQTGFVTNDKLGFIIGCSPDGVLDGNKKGIECKSRKQKLQAKTILLHDVPDENKIQTQAILFITEWEELDYISYSGGMPLYVKTVKPIAEYQDAIAKAATEFEQRLRAAVDILRERTADMPKTERTTNNLEEYD